MTKTIPMNWAVHRPQVGRKGVDIYLGTGLNFANVTGPDAAENATAIAATPQLLAACQSMLKTCGGSEHWQGETRKSLLLMEAAVAKAGFPHVAEEMAL